MKICLVCSNGGHLVEMIPLAEALGPSRGVPLDHDSVQTARDLGISFGD